MAKKQRHVRWQLVLTALALMGISGSAAAQDSTCEADEDCDHGYSCEVTGGGSLPCPGSEPCDGDGDCPPPPECNDEPIEIKSCVPSDDCSVDADCAEGWVCQTHEEQSCDDVDVGCSSDMPECPKPEPTECQVETITQCTPRWAAECEDASSCGPGFACVERIHHECSGGSAGDPGAGGAGGDEGEGSGFAPPPDAGVETDPVPPDDGCTEEGSGIFVCELQHVTCDTNADCQAGLSCVDSPVTSGCTRPAAPPEEGSGSGGADGAGIDAGAADGDLPADDAAPEPCELPEPERICAPEGYFEYGGGRGDVDYDGVAGNDDQGGGEAAPEAPDGDGDENGGPTSGMSPTESEDGSAMEESSGCRAAGQAQGGSLALMALGLAGLVSRRKKQRA